MDEFSISRMKTAKPSNAGPLSSRRAAAGDYPRILELLTALDLDYPSRDLLHFWVYADQSHVAAIAELKPFPDFFLLSCVGVDEGLQGTGLGRAFLREILDTVRADVYLYTLVPGFFHKIGFREAATIPSFLPPRSYYSCRDCVQQGCTCMVRSSSAPGIS